MESPRPRNWNQKLFASYLGGTDEELAELRRALTELMSVNNKLNRAYKTKAARTELKEFLESVLYRLPGFVQDACFNPTRMTGLMGMAYKIKNDHMILGKKNSDVEPSASTGEQAAGVDHESEVVVQETRHDDNLPTSSAPIIIHSNAVVQETNAADATEPPVVVAETDIVGPPSKRRKATPPQPMPSQPPQSPQPDLLSRNIWVLNEVNPSQHGLCSIQELLTSEEARKPNHIPRIADLDFDHWLSIVEAQCGYDFTAHRLEYRPPSAVMARSLGLPPITIPMSTQSQWRGALNSQLHAKTGQDPVFHLVFQSGNEVRPPSLPPLPSPSSGNDASRPRDPLVIKQEYVEGHIRLSGMR